MKVIITGCDLTGKTTLISKLREHYNDPTLSYLHFSYRDRRDICFYQTMLDKEHFIADRHFLDEMIYPKIFNRKPQLNRANFEMLLDYCKVKDIKIIILTLSQDELLQRSKLRNEEPEIQANLLKINAAYVDMGIKYNIPIFNTTINSVEEIIEYIDRKENTNEKYKSN